MYHIISPKGLPMLPIIQNNLEKFIQNKYLVKYNSIITKPSVSIRQKNDNCYYEKHHIIPRSLNLEIPDVVLLTAREHFVCHWLLTKCTNSSKLKFAFFAMCNQNKNGRQKRDYNFTSKTYETAKINAFGSEFKNAASVRANHYASTLSKEERSKKFGNHGNKNPMFGKTHSKEARDKIIKANTGRNHTQEFKNECSSRMKGSFGGKDQSGKSNNKFKGFYKTPYREEPFESSYQASEFILENFLIKLTPQTIWCRCTNPNRLLKNKLSVVQTKDWTIDDIGKTVGELGWFLIL